MSATAAKPRSPGFADEPTTTWNTSSPSASATGTTLPGLCGLAISGSRRDRTETSVRTRSRPMASSSSITVVPVASWVSVCSTDKPISEPGSGLPATR